MAEMFSTLGTWNWLIFGFVMMALELLAPGVFMFWLGLATLLVGLLLRSTEFHAQAAAVGEREGMQVEAVLGEAAGHLREMSATHQAGVMGAWHRFGRWML